MVIQVGEDRGEKHRVSSARVATGDNALRGTNHTVPVLCELVHDDMIFAVFPLLSMGFVTTLGFFVSLRYYMP